MRRSSGSNGKALRWAAKWLGLGPVKKRLVFDAVADALGVPHAKNRADGYALCVTFGHQFRFAAPPVVPARVPVAAGSWHDVNSDEFLASYEWRRVRMMVLKQYGARCQCCGMSAKDGITIHVDHIKPRRTHPGLALTVSNLQVLCEVCNHGKGAWDHTDWRPDSQLSSDAQRTPVTRSGDGDGYSDRRKVRAAPRLVRTQEIRGDTSTRLDQGAETKSA